MDSKVLRLPLLKPGTSYVGHQQIVGFNSPMDEKWQVKVTIDAVDLKQNKMFGHMEAVDVPSTGYSVVRTYWEGDVIDNETNSFFTRKWGATPDIDLEHWNHFMAFEGHRHSPIDVYSSDFVFMRWKEKLFLSGESEDCGLTIAGFYYLCLERNTGMISGYYYDPNTTPHQLLLLSPVVSNRGYTFPSYTFA